jgi:hypothetical protein
MNRARAAIPSAPARTAIRGKPGKLARDRIVGYASERRVPSQTGPAIVSPDCRVDETVGRFPVGVDGG